MHQRNTLARNMRMRIRLTRRAGSPSEYENPYAPASFSAAIAAANSCTFPFLRTRSKCRDYPPQQLPYPQNHSHDIRQPFNPSSKIPVTSRIEIAPAIPHINLIILEFNGLLFLGWSSPAFDYSGYGSSNDQCVGFNIPG